MTVLLDTDIGADSDDAVALGYLSEQVKSGRCKLPLLTLSTARQGAAGCARAILGELSASVKVGRMSAPLPCDTFDRYAETVCESFRADDGAEDAISCWRRLYLNSEEKIVPVVIGPQTNLARFMREEPALFAQKTARVYMMAGRFDASEAEWNVLQDIASAQYVAENMPCDAFLLPFEEGIRALTGRAFVGRENTPVGMCLRQFALHDGIFDKGKILRESWDPFTVLSVFRPELFSVSERGEWKIADDGVCTLSPNETGRFCVLQAKDALQAAEAIESVFRF